MLWVNYLLRILYNISRENLLDCTWTGDGTCGGANGNCVENNGTYACVCKNGYTGDQCDTAPTGKHLIIM